jgi:hypothetical protein
MVDLSVVKIQRIGSFAVVIWDSARLPEVKKRRASATHFAGKASFPAFAASQLERGQTGR